MKKTIFLSTAVLLSLGLLAGCGGGGGGGQSTPADPSSVTPPSTPAPSSQGGESLEPGSIDIGNVKVWCDQKVKAVTEAQLAGFQTAHPEYNISFTVEEVSESNAATMMARDPSAGADLYFFAQDQVSRLVQANALTILNSAAAATVRELNDSGSVNAASYNGSLYAFPATSDNGYFMYYDKQLVQELGIDITNLDDMVEKASAAHPIYFNLGDAFYTSGWFFAYGCQPVEYEVDNDGNFVDVHDTYNSPAGIKAATAMKRYAVNTEKFIFGSNAGTAFNAQAIACVSGTWDAEAVQTKLGDRMGTAILPRVRAEDGDLLTQLSSFAGFKLVGTKPQETVDRASAVRNLALWLTNEASQRQRFNALNWGPSNKVLQADPEVANNPVLKALWEQNALAKPQGQYPDGWWTLVANIAVEMQGGGDPTAACQAYYTNLPGTLD